MFTVKWVVKTELGETTRLFEAHTIESAYRNPLPPDVPAAAPKSWYLDGRPVNGALVVIDGMDGDDDPFCGHSFDWGTIYVMNESGATVAKYVLNETPIPVAQLFPQPVQAAA